jgi:hypothetical protein
MPVLKFAENQLIRIPELQFTDGANFSGRVKAGEGETLVVRYDKEIPAKILQEQANRPVAMLWEIQGEQHSCPVRVHPRGDGELQCRIVIEEKRQSLRMRVDVDMYFSPVDENHLREAAEAVMSRVQASTEADSEADRLMRAENQEEALLNEVKLIRRGIEKLSQQIEHLTSFFDGRAEGSRAEDVKALEVLDCSATGLAFRHYESFPLGTFLKIDLQFHSAPKCAIECIGRVARVDHRTAEPDHPDQFNIGVNFSHIHESDRERIVRQIFKVRRNLLRDRRAAA